MQLTANHYATGKPVRLRLGEGRVGAIEPVPGPGDPSLPVVAPGLVDLQINGYAGHDFNARPLPAGTVGRAVRLLWAEGVTACFPTVITAGVDEIADSLRAIAAECDADAGVGLGVAGIHLEGPFISPEDGARGAHRRECVRPPDWDLFRRWQDAAGGRIRIVTLSPEWAEAPAFVEQCAAAGVIVSIGHTAATPGQIAAAVRAGATMVTHFGNGAHLSLPRHPNYLWEQLAQDELRTCLIADGFHLPDQVLKVAMRVKGDRAMLVSDAVALAGLPPGPYETPVGGQVVLTPEGRLHLADNPGLLAGSAQMLLHGIHHLTSRGLATEAQAWEMASVRPARLVGLPQAAGIAVGAPADLVVFTRGADGRPVVESTITGGEAVYVAKSGPDGATDNRPGHEPWDAGDRLT